MGLLEIETLNVPVGTPQNIKWDPFCHCSAYFEYWNNVHVIYCKDWDMKSVFFEMDSPFKTE